MSPRLLLLLAGVLVALIVIFRLSMPGECERSSNTAVQLQQRSCPVCEQSSCPQCPRCPERQADVGGSSQGHKAEAAPSDSLLTLERADYNKVYDSFSAAEKASHKILHQRFFHNALKGLFADANDTIILKDPKPGEVCFDIGAFDGSDAVAYAKYGYFVFSIEPTPFSKQRNIINRIGKSPFSHNVQFISAAAGSALGIAPYHVADTKSTQSQVDSIGRVKELQDGVIQGGEVFNVPVVTVDSLLGPTRHVRLLKMDVQGYEFHAIMGAKAAISSQRVDWVHVETTPLLSEGGYKEAGAMVHFLYRSGYRCAAAGPCSAKGTVDAFYVCLENSYKCKKCKPWTDLLCALESVWKQHEHLKGAV